MKSGTWGAISKMGLPIPDDWDGVSKCCVIVEWPASPQWWAIFLGFITTPSVGRAWDAETGIVVEAQAVGQQIINDNSCLWEGFTMGCLEDLTNAINAQTAAMQSMGGCGCEGSGGSGTFEEPASEFVDDGEAFPSGYEDRAAYETGKCNAAQYVADQIKTSLQNISAFNIGGMVLSGVLTGLGAWSLVVVGVPWVGLLAIAGALLVIWAAQGTLTSAMGEAVDYIDNTFDICLIYNAQTAQDAQDAIYSSIEGETFTLSVTADILKNMFSLNAINLAFNPPPDITLPTGDCSGCVDDWLQVSLGNVVSDTGPASDPRTLVIDNVPSTPAGDWVAIFPAAGHNQGFTVSAISESGTDMVALDYNDCGGATNSAPPSSDVTWLMAQGRMTGFRLVTAGFATDPGQISVTLLQDDCP